MSARFGFILLALVWLAPLWGEPNDVRRIEERFIAPCCWSESVAVHRSEAAAEMRAEIERMVAQGKSEDQIVDLYVARYGEKILQEPRGPARYWLGIVPVALFVAGAMGLIVYLCRQRPPLVTSPIGHPPPPMPDWDID